MLRKKPKIKEAWQSKYATWIGRKRDDKTPQDTIHLGSYNIRFKEKIIGRFDVAVVKEGLKTAKLYVPIENRGECKRERKEEWTKVTRIRRGLVKEITCPLIDSHPIKACGGCKHRKTWTDYFIDCTCLDVQYEPSGSCEVILVKNT